MEQQDKTGYVMESCTANGGIRSVIEGVYAPGSMAPTHFHTKFNETFEVVEGELTVWRNKEKITLTPGKKATIEKGVLHSFKNISKNSVKLILTLEPGLEGMEQNVRIVKGYTLRNSIE
jgi:mannose-6-phosphate isomerase-like protein (cupin superfamily)